MLWNRDGYAVPISGSNRFRLWVFDGESIRTNYNSSISYGDHLTLTVNSDKTSVTIHTDNNYDYKGQVYIVAKTVTKIS